MSLTVPDLARAAPFPAHGKINKMSTLDILQFLQFALNLFAAFLVFRLMVTQGDWRDFLHVITDLNTIAHWQRDLQWLIEELQEF